MRIYGIALFVHMLGLIALFLGFAIQQRAGVRLRAASRHQEALPWSEMLVSTRTMQPAGALMLLVSGAYMTASTSASPPAWIVVGIGALLFIATATLAIIGPRLAAIHRSVSGYEGPLSPDATRLIRSGATWSVISAANGAAMGAVWIMSTKSGLAEALGVVVLLSLVGVAAGLRVGRSARGRPVDPVAPEGGGQATDRLNPRR